MHTHASHLTVAGTLSVLLALALVAPARAQEAAPKDKGGATKAPPSRLYRHPSGFTFVCPQGWTTRVAEGDQRVRLVPPEDAGNEVYLVTPDTAQGVASVKDPQFVPLVERGIGGLLPALKRTGEAEPITTGCGPGVVLTWAGATPEGLQVRGRVYATVTGDKSLLLFALAPTERLALRDKALRAVCASFAPDKAAAGGGAAAAGADADTPLVKAWRQRLAGKKLTRLGRYGGGAGGGGTYQTEIVLLTSGRFTYYSESSVSADVDGVSGGAGGVTRSGGKWRIITRGGNPVLELHLDGKEPTYRNLRYENGKTFMNGERIFVTDP